METIHVAFDPENPRKVIANGDEVGLTDTDLEIEADYYEITLSSSGFRPRKWHGQIANTTQDDPLLITFKPA